MAKGDAGRLEVTVVGARGLSASRTARVELVHGGGRRVRTRPAPRGLVSSPQQLVEFGDWFSFPLDGEILALTVVGWVSALLWGALGAWLPSARLKG